MIFFASVAKKFSVKYCGVIPTKNFNVKVFITKEYSIHSVCVTGSTASGTGPDLHRNDVKWAWYIEKCTLK